MMKGPALIAIAISLYYPVCGQSDSTYVHPKNFMLDEMVISANRWEQNIQEIPGKVSKVNASLIKFQNPQTAADLLTLTNNVFVQKSQLGGGSPMIRGFSTNRVLLVVDGVRMNNAIFRSGNVQNVISLDANAIEESEVVFGPGSVIYGSDAIGGVMDFHTLKSEFSETEKVNFTGNTLGRYASANHEKTGHVDFNIGLKKWAFRSSVTYASYDDLRMGKHGPDEYVRPDYVVRQNGIDVVVTNHKPEVQKPTGYDQINLMQKVRFKPNASWDFAYGFHYSKTSDYARYDRLILKEDEELSNAEWYYGPQQWMMNTLRADHLVSTSISDHVRMVIGYQDYEESRHNRNFGNARRTNRFEVVKAFSVNLDADKTLSPRIMLFYGAEFIFNKVGSTAFREDVSNGERSGVSTRYPDGSRWRSAATYLSTKIRISDHWILNASSRFNQVYTKASFDTTFFDFPFTETSLRNSALNGALGIVFNPSPKWKLYSNFSTGFRSPNVDDIGKVFDSEPGNVVVPNPELQAETAYNVEVGTSGKVGKNISIDAALYYTALNDAIARGGSTFNGEDSIVYDGVLSRVLSLQNISRIYVYGFQLGVEYRFGATMRFTSAFNWQNGNERDPATKRNFRPTHAAPSFGSTHIIYAKGKLTADLYAQYNGSIRYNDLPLSERADSHLYAKDGNGNPYASSWFTLNLKTSFQIVKNLAVDAGLENIFDKRYRPYSSGISAPGRNFIFSVRASW